VSAISSGASRLWDWVRGRTRILQRSLSRAGGFFQRGSIAARLFWLSAGWLIVALVATGILLTELYSRTLDQSLSETLEFYVEELVDLVLDSGDPAAPVRVPDPRFDRSASGWYWTIADAEGNIVNLSPSAVGVVLPEVPGGYDDTNARQTVFTDSFGRRIRIFQRAVTVGGTPLTLTVTGDLDEILGVVEVFRGQTLIVLLAVAIALAIMSFIVARIAFRPLQKLSRAIERVREGETENITGEYPTEIAPIADEVNELLRSNAQIIERAKNQVGNLAHGLKTPIAVLRNEAAADKTNTLSRVVLSESEKMQQLVTTYLDRARISARSAVVGKKADGIHVMLRLIRVMEKLHPNITYAMVRPDASLPWFRGDESDLEEMVGNLLDNASKWAKGQIGITMIAERKKSQTTLLIKIEDDGPGLTEEQAQAVLKRGVKLDEKVQGSGLGLDIVKELVDVYGGSLQLKRSVLGGLLAELRLPAAKLGGLGRSA
jgi:signal transduction histidine kinase